MKNVIWIIGEFSSGKDFAWEFLANKFWAKHLWISSSIRTICEQRKIPQTRENLQIVWEELTRTKWDSYLAEVLVQNIKDDFLVITWPRQLWQIEYFRDNTNCILIWVITGIQTRYRRMCERAIESEVMTFEEFRNADQLEKWKIQNVTKCLEYCDIYIENNGTKEEFKRKLDAVVFLTEWNWEK